MTDAAQLPDTPADEAVVKGPPEKKRALFTAMRFEDDCLALGAVGSTLSQRYAQFVDFAYEKVSAGGSGRGVADGSERDIAAVMASTASIRHALGDTCEQVTYAHNSLNHAAEALDRAEKAIDRAHPNELEPSERQERIRERPATCTQIAESKRAKASELRLGVSKLEREADKLDRQVKADERKAAEAKARAEGRPTMSKSQRRRAQRRSANGYTAPRIEASTPKEAKPGGRPDWRQLQHDRGFLPTLPDAGEQVDAMRATGALPQQDQSAFVDDGSEP